MFKQLYDRVNSAEKITEHMTSLATLLQSQLEAERRDHAASKALLESETQQREELQKTFEELYHVARQSGEIADGLRVQLSLAAGEQITVPIYWKPPPSTDELLLELQMAKDKADTLEETLVAREPATAAQGQLAVQITRNEELRRKLLLEETKCQQLQWRELHAQQKQGQGEPVRDGK